MKKLLFITIIAFGWAACNQSNTKSNDNKDSSANKMADHKMSSKDSLYGQSFDHSAPVKLTDLMKDTTKIDTTKNYVVEAVVTTVCQEKGCWFRAEDGKGGDVFIKIKGKNNTGDEVGSPMNTAAGTTVIFYGMPKYKEVSVKTLKHFAEDAGKSKAEIDAIKKSKMEWRFAATGVVIKG